MENTCRTCNHYRPHPDPMVTGGTCHRYAPRPSLAMVTSYAKDVPENVTEWPTVHVDDRCGEYIASLQEVGELIPLRQLLPFQSAHYRK